MTTGLKQGISEEALQLFSTNLEAYARICLQIRTKDARMTELVFNEEQKLINEMLKDQYQRTGRVRAIILKARQIGMSTYTSARFFRRLHLWPNHKAIVVADELDRAEELFGMYDRYTHFLPPEMSPMVRYASKKRELFFDNPSDRERGQRPGLGSGISVETAGDTSAGRGSTIQLAHLSEMSAWPNAFEVYISLRNAIPTKNSEIIIESTARGVGNLFHQMWKEAEEGEGKTEGSNGYLAIFFPWWSHKEYTLPMSRADKRALANGLDELETKYVEEGITWRGEAHKLTLEQINWRRFAIREMTLGDVRQFQQEYPATPDEAFLVSGMNFFDEDALKRYENETKSPKRRAFLVQPPLGGVIMQKNDLGYLRVWDLPRDPDPDNNEKGGLYVIGADTASGRTVQAVHRTADDPEGARDRPDFSSADVVDVRTRRQVAQLHGRMAPEIFAHQLFLLGNLYSTQLPSGFRRPARIAVEKNHASGATVLDLLQNGQPGKHGRYPNLFVHRNFNRRGGNKPTQYIGWLTNVETRQRMLDNLAQAIREGWLGVPCKETIGEMMTFVRDLSGKPQAQEGAHDDRVISLAIACMVMVGENLEPPKNYDHTTLVKAGTSATGWFDY